MHTIGVTRKNEITFDGEIIGTVVRVAHDTYDAIGNDGTVARNCYANGGAKHSAGFHLAVRTGLLRSGDSHIDVDHNGERVHGGPWTYSPR